MGSFCWNICGLFNKSKNGNTALHVASGGFTIGHLDVVKLLIQKGAKVNTGNKYEGTALHVASWAGHLEIVELLIQKGANINAKNESGWTALHFASDKGHLEVIELLLEKGANMKVKNNRGETPLDITRKNDDKKFMKIFQNK